jgi:hypothetical protein
MSENNTSKKEGQEKMDTHPLFNFRLYTEIKRDRFGREYQDGKAWPWTRKVYAEKSETERGKKE